MTDLPLLTPTATSAPRIKIFRDGAAGAGDGGSAGGTSAPGAADAGGAQPWFSALAEDLRGNANLTKYGSLEEFARGHIAQASLIGKPHDKLIELPTDDAGRLAVLRKLGAPEAVDGYKLTAPDNTPEGLTPEGPLAKAFLASAHRVGVLPDQAQAVYADFIGALGANLQEAETSEQATRAAGIQALKAEWGPAFDQNVAAARFAIDKLGGQPLKDAFEAHGLGDDPAFAKAFAQIGKLLAEDNSGGGNQAGGNPFGKVMAPAEAKSRADELLRQAMATADMHEQRRLNQEAAKYMKMAFPEG